VCVCVCVCACVRACVCVCVCVCVQVSLGHRASKVSMATRVTLDRLERAELRDPLDGLD